MLDSISKIKQEIVLRYDSVKLGYDDKIIFNELNLTLYKGQITMFCGPNGCGKSTALKALCRLIGLKAGSINLEDNRINLFSNRELARKIAMLTQSPSAPDELTVRQLVNMGRFAHQSYFSGASDTDKKAVYSALKACNLLELSESTLGSLSGGQLQRAWLAMVIAQDASIILLDEPTNHLDVTHQIEALELVRKLNNTARTVVVVMHDLNLAARYADRIIMFKEGEIVVDGSPEKVIQEDVIKDIFSVSCRVITDPVYGKPLFIPYP